MVRGTTVHEPVGVVVRLYSSEVSSRVPGSEKGRLVLVMASLKALKLRASLSIVAGDTADLTTTEVGSLSSVVLTV